MIDTDHALLDDPVALSQANRRFHTQLYLASHNNMLIEQLSAVHRRMALLANTSLAVDGRGRTALSEHQNILDTISARDSETARENLKQHLSHAFEARLQLNATGSV